MHGIATNILIYFFIYFILFLFKHRRQRAEATYMPVKSVQWTYMHDKQ